MEVSVGPESGYSGQVDTISPNGQVTIVASVSSFLLLLPVLDKFKSALIVFLSVGLGLRSRPGNHSE